MLEFLRFEGRVDSDSHRTHLLYPQIGDDKSHAVGQPNCRPIPTLQPHSFQPVRSSAAGLVKLCIGQTLIFKSKGQTIRVRPCTAFYNLNKVHLVLPFQPEWVRFSLENFRRSNGHIEFTTPPINPTLYSIIDVTTPKCSKKTPPITASPGAIDAT